jgi:hypothetical protein
MNCQMMISLGVYVLGAATTGERRLLEGHLPGCEECQAELWRLAPLPGMLAGIPDPVWQAPPPLARRSASRPGRPRARGRRGLGWTAAAAASIAAAVGGGLWLSPGGQQATALTASGADPVTHVSASATLTATSWGTSIQLQVRGLPENVECRLVVHSRTGREEVSGVWDAWAEGPVTIPASASWLQSDISSLQVTTTARSLLTISVPHPASQAGQGGPAS